MYIILFLSKLYINDLTSETIDWNTEGTFRLNRLSLYKSEGFLSNLTPDGTGKYYADITYRYEFARNPIINVHILDDAINVNFAIVNISTTGCRIIFDKNTARIRFHADFLGIRK